MEEKREVGREISHISHMIKRAFDDAHSRECFRDVHWPIGHIVRFVAENPDKEIYQKDIEKLLGTTRSSVSKVLDNMEKNGFITRQSVQSDARLKRIVLTQRSLELVEKIVGYKNFLESKIIENFDESEIDLLFSFLGRIESNLSELEKEAERDYEEEVENK